jgi:hypothetical protein
MDNTIELLVINVNGQKTAVTREDLDSLQLADAARAELEAAGVWEKVTLKDTWTGKDDVEVKQSIRRWDANIRQYVADDLRYPANLVARAVKEWTFENCPCDSTEGFLALPIGVSERLFIEVNRRLYPSLTDHPLLLMARS